MDILEAIIGIISFATQWRIALCIACTAVTGFLLATNISWISGLQGIFLGIAGAIPGVIWEESLKNAPTSSNPTPLYVELSAISLLSATWGAVSGQSISSFLFGAALLIVAVLIYQRRGGTRVPKASSLLVGMLASASFSLASVIGHQYLPISQVKESSPGHSSATSPASSSKRNTMPSRHSLTVWSNRHPQVSLVGSLRAAHSGAAYRGR